MVRENSKLEHLVPRDPQSEIVRRGVATTFTYASGPGHDYLRQLQKAIDANRKITYVKGKPREAGEPRLTPQQQQRALLHGIAQSYNPMILQALDELSAKTDDPAAKAQIEQAEQRDFGQEILDRIYARKNTKYANMDDKINRFGEMLSLDELPRYSPDQGPFDEWVSDKLQDIHDRVDAEHNKEMRRSPDTKARACTMSARSRGRKGRPR